MRLGFSIRQCDARLWIGKKSLFSECCQSGSGPHQMAWLCLSGAVQEVILPEKYDGGKMREETSYFVHENRRCITWSFWCLICNCFAALSWINWKIIFWRDLDSSPVVPIVHLFPGQGWSFLSPFEVPPLYKELHAPKNKKSNMHTQW